MGTLEKMEMGVDAQFCVSSALCYVHMDCRLSRSRVPDRFDHPEAVRRVACNASYLVDGYAYLHEKGIRVTGIEISLP